MEKEVITLERENCVNYSCVQLLDRIDSKLSKIKRSISTKKH